MAKEEGKVRGKEVPQDHGVDRLCAAIRMPGMGRPNVLFVGWEPSGEIIMTVDGSLLSEQARTSYEITKTAAFPYDREYAALPIAPVEFVGISKPFDRKSPLEQDILTYWITRGNGESEQIKIQELDILEAILNGQVVWEDFNEQAIMAQAQEKVAGLNMYSLLIPGKTAKNESVMYMMLFKPPMKHESNESMYRQFLVQTLQTLMKIDKDQDPEHRKGYLQAIGLEDTVASGLTGGVAVGILDLLRSSFPQFYRMSDERLEVVRRDSAGQNFSTQMKILLREFGLYNLPSVPRSADDLEAFPIDALLAVVSAAHTLVSEKLNN